MARKAPPARARVGNYAQMVDTVGVDEEMKNLMMSEPMDKIERDYVTGKGNSPSSIEAVRRARKANRRPLLRTNSYDY